MRFTGFHFHKVNVVHGSMAASRLG
ncbi:MAG: hypothetical protein JWR19_4305, partial [Pedosphaera sp.]|nr:hypothetical protein [Pedosphaera sp.]